jgi:poly [ADP-ribose] polymerase 2/3/4
MKKKQVKSLGRAGADDFDDDDDEPAPVQAAPKIVEEPAAQEEAVKDVLVKKVKTDEPEKETVKPAGRGRGAKAAAAAKPLGPAPKVVSKGKASQAAEETMEEKKPERTAGEVPVDEHVPGKSNYKVLQKDGVWYSKTMVENSVNSNMNKFYKAQVLERTTGNGSFMVFFRWGRIGVPGQSSNSGHGNATSAIAEYNKKCREKLGKGYTEVKLDFNDDDEDPDEKMEKSLEDCKIPAEVAKMIISIMNVKMFTAQVASVGFDAKRMPLGKLSMDAIDEGYAVLKNIQKSLKNKVSASSYTYRNYSSDFYKHIPHCLGHSITTEDILNTEAKVEKKYELLEMLSQFKNTRSLVDTKGKGNPVDNHYEKLKTTIKPLDLASDEAKLILRYAETTKAPSHASLKVKIEQIFSLEKESENATFKKDLSNHLLLWQGARMTSYAGILANGAQLPSPEAPNSAFTFGKGIYFTDVFSKAAQQCFIGLTAGVGYLLLAEVALGDSHKMMRPDPTAPGLPAGKHSTMACGRLGPDPANRVNHGGVHVPVGPLKDTEYRDSMIQFCDYVVFDPTQVKMKYLVKIQEVK